MFFFIVLVPGSGNNWYAFSKIQNDSRVTVTTQAIRKSVQN